MFKKLIVGVDFSENSERAVRKAVALANDLGAEVVLVHVISGGVGMAGGEDIATLRVGIEEQLRNWCTRLGAGARAKMEWGVVEGRTAEQLVLFIERWGGDLLVMGTSGGSLLPHLLTGAGATEKAVRAAPVPVLVVGPGVA